MTTFAGADKIAKALGNVQVKMSNQVAKAMMVCANEVQRQSVIQTPLQTGELRARAFTEGPFVDSSGTYQAVIGYEKHTDTYPLTSDGKAGEYAVYVHEKLEARHPIGKARFLADAFNAYSQNYVSDMAALLKGVFR